MELQAEKRTVLGKKVKALRRQGFTPVNLFGRGMESQSLQVTTTELHGVLLHTGQNALVDLAVRDGQIATQKVMVRDVQRHPISRQILHVDLYRVLMTEPMEVEVPIRFVGLAPAVDLNLGTLVHGVNEVRVLGLPGTLPSYLEVDVSDLKEAHQAIHAMEILLPKDVSLVSDPEQVVASIVARRGIAEEEAAATPAEVAPAPQDIGSLSTLAPELDRSRGR